MFITVNVINKLYHLNNKCKTELCGAQLISGNMQTGVAYVKDKSSVKVTGLLIWQPGFTISQSDLPYALFDKQLDG